MKYGILGDIHANSTALRVALRQFQAHGVDQVLSVGDVVGYGAAPAECIELLIDAKAIVVKGNHDAACVDEVDDRCFNQAARDAIQWTRDVLEEEDLEWLRALPLSVELEHCQIAHGTPFEPENFNYFVGLADAQPSIDCMTRRVCFVGHSHIPISVMRLSADPMRLAYSPDSEIDLVPVERALINVGSVGQPRDEDPRLAYAIFDASTWQVTLHRSEYDIEREAARIRSAGLPTVLADRLYLGV